MFGEKSVQQLHNMPLLNISRQIADVSENLGTADWEAERQTFFNTLMKWLIVVVLVTW